MNAYEVAFYVSWVFVMSYVISNHILVKKVCKLDEHFRDQYQKASSMERSSLTMSLVFGEMRNVRHTNSSVGRQVVVSQAAFAGFVVSFLVFVVMIFL